MSALVTSRLPKPDGWIDFEKQVRSMAKIRWETEDFSRNGRPGQEQNGVDVFGQDKSGAWIGLQCKNTVAGVSEATICSEVVKAEEFSPALSKLYIVTTADADAKIQAAVRKLSDSRRAISQFPVWILFWEDVCDELTRDESRLYQHFPHLKPLSNGAETKVHDRSLFQRFQKEFAFDPSIRLLRDHDFRAAFKWKYIKPLSDFVDTWDNAEHEFTDFTLQKAFQDFYCEARTMSRCLSDRTTLVGSREMLSVCSDFENYLGSRPEHIKKHAKELNDAARKFVPIYEEFVRLCRSKLLA
jgi:hypothetical protein